jgi:hypothetical protein
MRNAAGATALYVDSLIAPLLLDMRKRQELTDGIRRALDETLDQGALGKRLVSFKLWRRDGKIFLRQRPGIDRSDHRANRQPDSCIRGNVMVEFDQLDATERQEQKATNGPLLEIYNPVWSGNVVAV